MDGFLEAIALVDVQPNGSKQVQVGEKPVIILSHQGQPYALSAICAHALRNIGGVPIFLFVIVRPISSLLLLCLPISSTC